MILDEATLDKLSAGVEIDGQRVEAEQVDEVESEPELEGTTEAKSEESTDSEHDEEAQPEDWRDKRFAQMAHKKNRAEEKLKEYQERLDKLEKAQAKPTEALPEIPDYPSADLQYDDPEGWKRQLAAREQAIAERAQAEYRLRLDQEQSTKQQQTQFEQQQNEVRGIVDAYTAAGIEAGISKDKMAYNEEILTEAGVTPNLAKYLYSDAKGPQLVDYLAGNPEELGKLSKMNAFQAVEYIVTNVRPKAGVSKSKVTKAPDPVSRVKGTGKVTKDDFDSLLPAGYSIS